MQTRKSLNDSILTGRTTPDLILFDLGELAPDQDFKNHCVLEASKHEEFSQTYDPYGEHSGGRVLVNGNRVYFRVLNFDRAMCKRAASPFIASNTINVLLFYV